MLGRVAHSGAPAGAGAGVGQRGPGQLQSLPARVRAIRQHAPRTSVLASAQEPDRPETGEQAPAAADLDELKAKFFPRPPTPAASRQPGTQSISRRSATPSSTRRPGTPEASRSPDGTTNASITANPYELGRQARRAFNEVWDQVSRLASPTKSFIIDDTMVPSTDQEFDTPQAAYTTVLVVGATGRVGRILTRKLLLRGYQVRALVRRKEGSKQEDEGLSAAVDIVYGDLAEPDDCQEAVRGVTKVIFCAAAKSTFTADLTRVEDRGVMNIAKALQDEFVRQTVRANEMSGQVVSAQARNKLGRTRLYSHVSKLEIADFSHAYHQQRWDITWVGTPDERADHDAQQAAKAAAAAGEGGPLQRPSVPRWVAAASSAKAEINYENHLVFEGSVAQKGTYAEVGADISTALPMGQSRTASTEAVTMRVKGDGNAYICCVTTAKGYTYVSRFPTRKGYLNLRLPWSSFRSDNSGQPPLQPDKITRMSFRYEIPRRPPPSAATAARLAKAMGRDNGNAPEGKFCLEVDWIKAVPSGQEPDMVLVSAAGAARAASMPAEEFARVVMAKRRGEANLRNSGLGYTIIRPGLIVDEPGGYKTLVFDQGDRIDQPISAADVADICLRALHETAARNKTFDVCYEMASEGSSSMYELVSSAPDIRGNYLAQAANVLARNT